MTTPGLHWTSAAEVLDGDPEGEQLKRSQAVWARAVAVATGAFGGEIICEPAVFAPMSVGGVGGFVVCRSRVRVSAPRAGDLLTACRAAWERWWHVDEGGHERPEAEVDPFDEPVRDGDAYVLGYDVREVEDCLPLRAGRCLEILLEELQRHRCTPAHVTDAT